MGIYVYIYVYICYASKTNVFCVNYATIQNMACDKYWENSGKQQNLVSLAKDVSNLFINNPKHQRCQQFQN